MIGHSSVQCVKPKLSTVHLPIRSARVTSPPVLGPQRELRNLRRHPSPVTLLPLGPLSRVLAPIPRRAPHEHDASANAPKSTIAATTTPIAIAEPCRALVACPRSFVSLVIASLLCAPRSARTGG